MMDICVEQTVLVLHDVRRLHSFGQFICFYLGGCPAEDVFDDRRTKECGGYDFFIIHLIITLLRTLPQTPTRLGDLSTGMVIIFCFYCLN